ncbi:MAG: aminotransferase class III-fold pyridoxal phosphate-dependent enzyme [Verrucomicrobia bacterium]|nr:aminotransferase class III-fold pyridoxal phosphate-dependent enzyme [Verrucomicrobiota bacterium]
MHPLAKLDHQFVWHPFTQMRDWLRAEPIVIVEGRGAVLRDARGREYLDANSSIWTNLHGHRHPRLDAALRRQLGRIAHSSALGLANEPASHLAARLVAAANPPAVAGPRLAKVFFSDDGSTALEVALKLAYEFTRRCGRSARPRFLSLAGGYHGDTMGAVSLGHIDRFHAAYRGLLFKTGAVMAPYCYRCPHNRAAPERRDAREHRRCQWECVAQVERKFSRARAAGRAISAFVVEPLIQGAAGMIPQPAGWLRQVAEIARAHNALLIADEVLTGFGRTGTGTAEEWETGGGAGKARPASLFACHREGVQPDFLCLAKGLTGGYLPMAATLTTPAVFDAFLGEYGEFKTFFHGHSYTGNQLGAAVALASLELLEAPAQQRRRRRLEELLRAELRPLWQLPAVGDIRQVGLIAGIELVADWQRRTPFDLRRGVGQRVSAAMARRGVLTRPIGNVIVLMPPYCTAPAQLRRMVAVLAEGIEEATAGQNP